MKLTVLTEQTIVRVRVFVCVYARNRNKAA
jgi:hypothetical protein